MHLDLGQLLLAVVHQILESEGVFFVWKFNGLGGLGLFDLGFRLLEVEHARIKVDRGELHLAGQRSARCFVVGVRASVGATLEV